LLERDARIGARVQDQRRHADLRQQGAHVDLAEGFEDARRDFGPCGRAHQVAEPAHLLRVRIGNEQRREQLPERWILLPPALADQLDERLAVASLLLAALSPAFSVAAVQHEALHALRMPDRVLDAGGAALRDAEQWKPLEPA
jgi:hypothetical protein